MDAHVDSEGTTLTGMKSIYVGHGRECNGSLCYRMRSQAQGRPLKNENYVEEARRLMWYGKRLVRAGATREATQERNEINKKEKNCYLPTVCGKQATKPQTSGNAS